MLRTRSTSFRALDARTPQEQPFAPEAEGSPRTNGRASGAELLGSEAVFPPVLTVYEVARLLRMNVDSVRRIDRALLPYMHGGAGKWALYALSDVLAYVCKSARTQSGELDFKDQHELIGEILGSARGRSSQPRGMS